MPLGIFFVWVLKCICSVFCRQMPVPTLVRHSNNQLVGLPNNRDLVPSGKLPWQLVVYKVNNRQAVAWQTKRTGYDIESGLLS